MVRKDEDNDKETRKTQDINLNVSFENKPEMDDFEETKEYKCRHGRFGALIYGLGFIGAAIHYLSIATGFWIGALGILKSLVWPAFVVYGALKLFGL